MLISRNWLKNYIKLPDVPAKDMGLAITMATVEVEDVVDQSKNLEGIVVGKILEVVKHPDADRLSVCRVDVREGVLQIVCGGSNVAKGMLVAVAKVGSKLKWHGEGELTELKPAKIRGVESNGMIVASSEIGLTSLFPAKDDHEIVDLSPYRLHVGDQLSHALGLDDVIFEIDNKSMTHRPDLWGHYGMAREIAAIYQAKLKPLASAAIPRAIAALPLNVTVEDGVSCPRYMALVVDNVTSTESPWWLKRDLEAVGLRSVNMIVDVTNYVMLALGQPLHAFDYQEIHGHTIKVGTMPRATTFKALNDKEYEITPDMLLIKDSDRILGIAGIMGGLGSKVSNSTKTFVIESAHFAATPLRRTSVALNLRTDASARYEKKLDSQLCPQALAMAVDLLRRIDPGITIASEVIDIDHTTIATVQITIAKAFIDARLGVSLDAKDIGAILKRLTFDVQFKKGMFTVQVPSYRQRDIQIPEDIVEEVARIYGYDNIPVTLPTIEMPRSVRSVASVLEREVKTLLTYGCGYTEVYAYSFADPAWSERLGMTRNRLSVKNYLTPDQRYLRSSLLPQLLAQASANFRFSDDFSIFELGRIFSKQPGEFSVNADGTSFLPRQPRQIAGLVITKSRVGAEAFREVKGTITSVLGSVGVQVQDSVATESWASQAVGIKAHDKVIGQYGLLTDAVAADVGRGAVVGWWYCDFDALTKFADFSRVYKAVSKYPSIVRDIAIEVPLTVTWASVQDSVSGSSKLLQSVAWFDEFVGGKLGSGKKSIAFRLTFASPGRTLEASEVSTAIDKIAAALKEKCGAVVR